MNLPMLVVWIITLSVAFIVIGVGVSYRAEGTPIGMAVTTFAAITILATGFTVGFFVTHFSSPTLETWWWALAVRVTWQLGGAMFFAVTILADAQLGSIGFRKPGPWVFLFICTAIGVLASLNPLRDLIQGPVTKRGTPNLEVVRRARAKYGPSIRTELQLVAPDGTRYQTNMAGWPAGKAEEILNKCTETDNVEITLLQYTNRILDGRCL